MKKEDKKSVLIYALVLLLGLFTGWLLFSGDKERSPAEDQQEELADQEADVEYTCSMHPQVRQNQPGDCPICGMELIPVDQGDETATDDPFHVTMSQSHADWANIRTMIVESSSGGSVVSLTGEVAADERESRLITATFPGRIEELYADYTGRYIQRGERLARIYSAELMQAQQELIMASRQKEQQPRLYNAARNRLELYNLTQNQINQIEQRGEASPEIDIFATLSGFLVEREVSQGDYVNVGQALFEVADLSQVWVELDAYENQVSQISEGDSAVVRMSSQPGQQFAGSVEFVDPVIDPDTRTARVRLTIDNEDNMLKPGMFVNAVIMNTAQADAVPVVPHSAVLWTGESSVVYVKVPQNEGFTFEFREIETGARTDEHYRINDGLNIGEEIAVNGVFAIDASAQLKGSFSMMSPPDEVSLPEPFKSNLALLFSHYFDLKNALANDDAPKALEHAGLLDQQLESIGEHALSGEHHEFWIGQHAGISEGVEQFISAQEDIEEQRVHFEALSMTFIETARTLGAIGDTWFVAWCPMVDDNRGAFWLSEFEEIMNPYFGSMMLRCGEVKEIIRPGVGQTENEQRVADPHVH